MVATPMLLKPRVLDPRRRDDISEVLADITTVGERTVPGYYANWYPPGLKEITLGPHANKLTGVSRYYPTLDPPVVVDFEPAPPDKWFHDEKVRFFTERKVLYLPIALTDQLTEEQFAARYREARIMLDRSGVDMRDAAALALPGVEEVLQHPDLQAALDARAAWDVDQTIAAKKAAGGYRVQPPSGGGRRQMILARKRKLLETVRRELKVTTDGVDIEQCCRELTDPIERRADGQIRPSEPGGPGT